MNTLEKFFFEKEKKYLVHKWHHYFPIYDRHFSKFQGRNPVILEIGVGKGGSLEMWNDYFNGNCTIIGIDIREECLELCKEFNNVEILIGNQNDVDFLKKVREKYQNIDILIDDGSHKNKDLVQTFEYLYPSITKGGVYLLEDLHTSYWEEYYDGGYKKSGTIIEYAKDLVDKMNAQHIRHAYVDPEFSLITDSLHFYDSILVIEKKLVPYDKIIATKRGPGV